MVHRHDVARLKPGVTIAAAQADMSALYARMAESNRRYRSRDANVVWLTGEVARDSRLGLLVLFGATGCVLLIGCINVANLLLLRAAGRSRELAIRTALGAGRWRLARQVVGEAVALASAGGAAGLVLATWGVRVLLAAIPHDLFPRIAEVRIDLDRPRVRVRGVAGRRSCGEHRADLAHARPRSPWRDQPRARRRSRARRARAAASDFTRRTLVVAQVAIAMVLLVGAGLLAETYVRLTRVDLGLDPSIGSSRSASRFRRLDTAARPRSSPFRTRCSPVSRRCPGVEAAGLTNSLPVQPTMLASMTVEAEGQPASEIPESVQRADRQPRLLPRGRPADRLWPAAHRERCDRRRRGGQPRGWSAASGRRRRRRGPIPSDEN